jgi:hypothetical protein
VVATDAGRMEIQWKEAEMSRCAGARLFLANRKLPGGFMQGV